MLPVVAICLLFLRTTSVAGYGAEAEQRLWAKQNMYPGAMFPKMQPAGQGYYQRFFPYQPSQLSWENTRLPMPFYHIPACNIPSHQNIHMMQSPFFNQNQWTGIPFQSQGQWQKTVIPNKVQEQWNKPEIKDKWGHLSMPNNGKDKWQQPFFQTKDNNLWKQSSFNNNQGQWNQPNFQNQGQNKWQQTTNWNIDPNVKMIGEWDTFPVNDQMLRQPAISDLSLSGTKTRLDTVKPAQSGRLQTVGLERLDDPIQSRRLR